MKPSASVAARAAKYTLSALCAAALGVGLMKGTVMAQSIDFNTDLSIAELMEALVMPEADVIWSAVQFSSSEEGETMIGPETDEEWLVVRHSAIALEEIANNLMIPGRAANKPGTTAPEGELSPAEIEALIDSNRAAWNAYAETLRSVAMQTVDAVDERDVDKIFLDTGGALDAACEACHQTFWYPE